MDGAVPPLHHALGDAVLSEAQSNLIAFVAFRTVMTGMNCRETCVV
jgi:hypothetical protein